MVILDASLEGITHRVKQDFDLTTAARQQYRVLNSRSTITIVIPNDRMASDFESSLSAAQEDATQRARECSQDFAKYASITTVTPSTTAYVESNGQIIAGNFCPIVSIDLYAESLKDTIVKSEKWSERIFHLVAWDAFSKAFSKLSRTRQVSYSKLTHRLLQTNSRNKLFYGTTATCPCCNQQEETIAHVFACPSQATPSARDELLVKYKDSLQDAGSPDDIHGISAWIRMHNGTLLRQVAPTVGNITKALATAAYVEQTRLIGWEAFLHGRISKSWVAVYKTYFPTADGAETTTWMSDVIRVNWDFALAMWHHKNGIVHGIDEVASRNKILLKLHQEVRMEYPMNLIPSSYPAP
jgi:hypothetical protein